MSENSTTAEVIGGVCIVGMGLLVSAAIFMWCVVLPAIGLLHLWGSI